MRQLIDHIAGNNAFRRVGQINVLPDLFAARLNQRADAFVDGRRGNRRFNHDHSAFRANGEHFFHRRRHIARIRLLGAPVIRGRHRDDVGIGLHVARLKLNARLQCLGEQLVQPLFLKRRLSIAQRLHQRFVLVRADYLHAMRGQHQRRGQTDVTQPLYVYHLQKNFLSCCKSSPAR